MNPPLPDVTWAALLAHYTQIAQASRALPKTPAGDRWRAAVPALIGLSAVAAALGDMDALPQPERALSLTKGDVLIKQYAKTIHDLWRAEPLPDDVRGLIDDARAAAQQARDAGVLWLVPADLEPAMLDAPAWDDLIDALGEHVASLGLLMLPARGETLLPGTPRAFARGLAGGAPPAPALAIVRDALGEPAPAPGPVQTYRQIHAESGGVARDLIAPIAGALPPGKPLLVPAVESGRVLPAPALARSRKAQWQSFGPWRVEHLPAGQES